jgi:transcriptional repressor NrdR
VIKRDGRREKFDRNKLRGGIEKACEKRPVSREQIEMQVEEIMDEIEKEYDREVPSTALGEKVMQRLRQIDEVAYVRFASVYRQFRDLKEFADEIQSLEAKR